MKETRDRRTLTQALVLYSRLGASYECRSPFEVSERIRGSVGDNHALALDLWSVYQMLLFLRVSKEAEVTKALHSIYFKPFYK